MELNPEDTTWDEVIMEAENEEIVLLSIEKDNVQGDKCSKDMSTPSKSFSLHSLNASKPGSNSIQCPHNFRNNNERHLLGYNNSYSGQSSSSNARNPTPGNSQSGNSNASSGNRLNGSSGGCMDILQQEHQKLQSEGKCFLCKQAGHIACNCPKANILPGKGGEPPGIHVNNIDFTEHMVDKYLPDEGNSAHIELAMLGFHDDTSHTKFTESLDSDIPGLSSDPGSNEILADITKIGTHCSKFLAMHYVDDQLGGTHTNAYTWMLGVS
ncbi:hypothetical protein BDN71DRAFT_1511648 [Pleurotus eryngii]|uniref:CCHC-type domain-containing protein n=1 Tax=Pleurotus eryngii TaxID=5323 RepID=A0A9P6DC10_PLEER|nr:hypothetical protein BDN71DRAFT_1511648 [Pleurotus eryngii]